MPSVMEFSVTQVNLPAVYVANGLGICLLMVILLDERRSLRVNARDGYLFRWMCRLCFVLCILETCGFVLEGKLFLGARQMALVCSAAILMLAAGLAYIWVCYVDSKLFPERRQTRLNCPLAAVPAVLVVLMALANLFFPLFFGITPSNNYYRGVLFLLPWIVVYGYMAWGASWTYRYQRKADKHLFIPVMTFLIPVYLAGLVQLFCYGISIIWASVAVGLTCLYINLQSEQAYLDPLTRLHNRSYLLHYMDRIGGQAKKGLQITGIMLDINNFKSINDTLGHSGGDAVLRTMGKLLRRAAGDHIVVRYGGDEFVILMEDSSPAQVQAVLDRVCQVLQDYNSSRGNRPPIFVSTGSAEFDQMDVFRFFHEMDMKMYEEKRAFYLRREIHETSNDITAE